MAAAAGGVGGAVRVAAACWAGGARWAAVGCMGVEAGPRRREGREGSDLGLVAHAGGRKEREWARKGNALFFFSTFSFLNIFKLLKGFEFKQIRTKFYEGYRISETNFSPNATSKHDANFS